MNVGLILRSSRGSLWVAVLSAVFAGQSPADPNNPGIQEPVLSTLTGTDVRYPYTDQADGGMLKNVVGNIVTEAAINAPSALGHRIISDLSPNDDMHDALKTLAKAAKDSLTSPVTGS